MTLKRVTIWVEAEEWEGFKTLPDPYNRPNASHHIREAMRLYTKVIKTESPCGEPERGQHSATLFEDQDRESDKSIHATNSSTVELSPIKR